MKVLHINSYYSNRFFYKNLFEKQLENGLEIDVFVPIPTSLSVPKLDLGGYTSLNVTHQKYDRFFFHLKHRKIWNVLKTKYHFNEYDVIHAHSLFSNGYMAMKLKRAYKIPYVVVVRRSDVNTFFKYMLHLRKLGIQILSEADQIIFLSKPYRKYVFEKYIPINLKEKLYNKTLIIPNGINDFWLDSNKNKDKAPGISCLKILYVGQVRKNKNILTTVEAIKILQEKGYEVSYTIAGEIYETDYFSQISQIPFINYLPPQDKEALKEIYQSHDIFVMPSISEAFGIVYAEAMSQGLPVVYTKNQGFDGQFENGEVGYAVDCFNPQEIAERIEDIVKNYSQLSKNCLLNADAFSWDKINQNVQDVYLACTQ